VAQDTALSRR